MSQLRIVTVTGQ